jgi:hypothetical protein
MEISSEEGEKKTETSLSSNEIRQDRKQVSLDRFLVKVAQKENESTDSDSVSDNESHRTQ